MYARVWQALVRGVLQLILIIQLTTIIIMSTVEWRVMTWRHPHMWIDAIGLGTNLSCMSNCEIGSLWIHDWTLQCCSRLYAHQSLYPSHMAWIAKNSVRLIGLGLLIYFIMKISIAVNKLQDKKVATATTRRYEHNRLFPSISICFRKKFRRDYTDNLEHALNISR